MFSMFSGPRPGEERDPLDNIRNPGSTVIFALLSCGLYLLLWYYRNIREIAQGARLHSDDEPSPTLVTKWYIAMVLGSALPLLLAAPQLLESLSKGVEHATRTPLNDPTLFMFLVQASCAAVGVWFVYLFLSLVKTARERVGLAMEEMRLLLILNVISSLVFVSDYLPQMPRWSEVGIKLVMGTAGLVYLIRLQSTINGMWERES